MRRFRDWLGGALWGVLVYRLWARRRRAAAAEPVPAEGPDERAEELRAKLAETRETGAEEEPAPPAEPGPPESLEERRRRVHEEGRAAIDEMRGD